LAANTTIFYFTGTGNSLKVARDLAEQLGDAELVAIPQVVDGEIPAASECVGVVFPTYFGGMPLMVRRFLGKMPLGDYVFAVATAGGMAGASLRQAARILRARGAKLAAAFAVNMPGNYTRFFDADPDEKQQKLFAEEAERVKAIAQAVSARETGRMGGPILPVAGLCALLNRFYFRGRAHRLDRLFSADEKCNGCGICAKVCPAGDIELREERPVWQGRCEQCYACLQWCPQEAIQGNKKTPGRRRYHHPDVTLKDIIESNNRTPASEDSPS